VSSKGLSPNVRTNPNSTQPQGTVIKQNPLAGTSVKPGSSVTLVVSGGGIKVPNEIGQSLQVAQGTLQGFGLNTTVRYVPATGGTTPGTVVGMDPGPGTVVPKGASITLQVAKQQPTPSPSTSPPTSPPTTPPTSPPTTPPSQH
jgi:beta-lactam-binding protein with PASTA domain